MLYGSWCAGCMLLLAAVVRGEVLSEDVLSGPDVISGMLGGWRSITQNQECRRDIVNLLVAANRLQPAALRVLDASGGLPAGVLHGNIKSLGHYDECLRAEGRYCLASVHVTPSSDSPHELRALLELATLGRADSEITLNRSRDLAVPDLLPSLALAQVGVCFPRSCGAGDVESAVSAVLGDVARPLGVSTTAEVSPHLCSPLRPAGWLLSDLVMLTLLGTLVTLALLASLLDTGQRKPAPASGWRGLVSSFSVPANWQRLTRLEEANSGGAISCLDGVRVFSTFWVLMSHKAFFMLQQPCIDQRHLSESMGDVANLPFSNGMPSVDTFFFMAGLLRGQSLLRDLRAGTFHFRADAFRRYLRLTPPYAVMVLFYATLLPRLGDGPLWPKVVTESSRACQVNWPYALLYLNNYLHNGMHCWHLAADMHLYLLAPLLVVPALRRPRLALPLLVGTVLLFTAIHFLYALATAALPTYVVGASDLKNMHYQMSVHMPTHFRVATYTVGIALAFVLHNLNPNNIHLTKSRVAASWVLGLGCLGGVMLGGLPLFASMRLEIAPITLAAHGALQRPLWALGLALIVFLCHTGHGGWVNGLLSARVFQPLSRLSYSVFLSHYTLLMMHQGRLRSPVHVDHLHVVHGLAGDITLSLVLALPLHLLVEAPTLRLVAQLLGNKSRVPAVTEGQGTFSDHVTETHKGVTKNGHIYKMVYTKLKYT